MSPRILPPVLIALLGLVACSDHDGAASGSGSQVLKQVAFETRAEIPIGADGAVDAVLADVDGDGKLDLVAVAMEGKVQTLLGQGNGTFTAVASVTLPGKPFRIEGLDLDTDLDLDLVVLRAEDGKVTTLLNDGSGRFSVQQTLAVGDKAVCMGLIDGNGDALPDLVVGTAGTTPALTMYPVDSLGNFGAPKTMPIPAGTRPAALCRGDADNDGLDDLAVADAEQDLVLVFPTKFGAGFATPFTVPSGNMPVAVAVGKLGNDTRTAIVSGAHTDEAIVIQRRAVGSNAWEEQRIPLEGPPAAVALRDLDGDTFLDLIVTIYDRASVSVFPGTDSRSFGAELQLVASALPFQCLVGDVNGDKRQDLIATCTGDRMSLFAARTDGALNAAYNYRTGIRTPEFVAAADFDGDGAAEVACAGSGAAQVSILGHSTLPFTGPGLGLQIVLNVDVGRPVFNVVKGDFNRDGRPDLAVATEGGVKILGNVSGASGMAFAPVPADPGKVITPGKGPFEIAAQDMSGDGADDLVITDAWAQTVTVVRAVLPGLSYETKPEVLPLPGRPIGLAVADFTGDGSPDVAISLVDRASLRLFRNDGFGRLATLFDVPVPPGPCYLRTADFNEDGRLDLVVSNAGADRLTVLLAQAQGFVTLEFTAGKAPTALLTADLNRDGHADILVASFQGADFRVLLGDGKGGFPAQIPFAGTYRATGAALADFDGDKLLDLAISSLQSWRLSAYRNLSR